MRGYHLVETALTDEIASSSGRPQTEGHVVGTMLRAD